MRRLMIVLGLLVLLLSAVCVAYAAGNDEVELVLPPFIVNLVIGGVAIGPIISTIVQIAKKLGIIPDGWSGHVVLGLCAIVVLLAVGAQWFEIEAEVGGILGVLEGFVKLIASYVVPVAGSTVFYAGMKKLQVFGSLSKSSKKAVPSSRAREK